MTGLALAAAGAVLCVVAVFAEPPVTAAWVPGVFLVLAGWHVRATAPQRAAARRRAGRRGWIA